MPIGQELQRVAAGIAERMQQRGAQLQHEIEHLETVLAKKKVELDAADQAHHRLTDFAAEIGSDYQCPALLDGTRNAVVTDTHCWRNALRGFLSLPSL